MANGLAKSTPCVRLPILVRAHRDDHRAPSGANRRGTRALPIRSGGTARNFPRTPRGVVRAGRGALLPRPAARPGSVAAWPPRASVLHLLHAVPPADHDEVRALHRAPFGYPIRAFSRAITASMLSPSARAVKVSAIRCLRMGSARSSTSSIEGARRRSSKARARTASMSA
jgi:hypothetical protein